MCNLNRLIPLVYGGWVHVYPIEHKDYMTDWEWYSGEKHLFSYSSQLWSLISHVYPLSVHLLVINEMDLLQTEVATIAA